MVVPFGRDANKKARRHRKASRLGNGQGCSHVRAGDGRANPAALKPEGRKKAGTGGSDGRVGF
jgi:hypothetical protein